MRLDKRTATIQADRADPLYAKIGVVMGRIRRERGMTQQDVGLGLGMDAASISLYESARNRLTVGIFVRWCETLQVEPSVALARALEERQSKPRVPGQTAAKEERDGAP